jgi:hypothetical protein
VHLLKSFLSTQAILAGLVWQEGKFKSGDVVRAYHSVTSTLKIRRARQRCRRPHARRDDDGGFHKTDNGSYCKSRDRLTGIERVYCVEPWSPALARNGLCVRMPAPAS